MWGSCPVPSPRMRASSLGLARILIELSTCPGIKSRVFPQPARSRAGVRSPGNRVHCPGTLPHSGAGCKLLGSGLDGTDQAAVGIVPQPGERVVLVGPEHFVDLVVVVADLLERSHLEPADGLLDLPAIAP